jgi:hypothetical protein
MERHTLSITVEDKVLTAYREAHTTGGADPTHTVRWVVTGGEMSVDVREFQGGYTGTINGADVETDNEILVKVHTSLEAAFDFAQEQTRCTDEDPQPGPEYYR